MAVTCRWPWGCALTCPPLACQPQTIHLPQELRSSQRQPNHRRACCCHPDYLGGSEGGCQPHHVPCALLKEIDGHSPEHLLSHEGQSHPTTTGLVLNRMTA